MRLLTPGDRRKGLTRNFSAPSLPSAPLASGRVMLVLAHRGSRLREPENTVSAFSRAVAEGADGVELDVHRTVDDALVVCHDAGTPAGVLCEMPLSAVRRAFPLVPTLAEALDACAGTLVNVEIKNMPPDPDWDPVDRAAELVVALLGARTGDDVVVSSFNLATIDKVRTLAPDVATAYITFGQDPLEGLRVAESHGHGGLHPDVGSLAGPVAGAVAANAAERRLAVRPWTVNDPEQIRALAAAGIDAVITDDPLVALRALRR
jgi:glycerophosphoryl diester phosphodiesterase